MDSERRIAAVAALDQPIRKDLFRFLLSSRTWVSRDEAADALGVARSVAAFHLDKLAEAGAVEVRFERTSGRSGPGAGRPSKLYRPTGEELAASMPDRRYDLAGSLLAEAVATATDTGQPVAECLKAVAHRAGHDTGEGARDQPVLAVLTRCGYEPAVGGGEIALMNCPFHRLAEEQRALVCGMNLDFVDGLIEGHGEAGELTARLDPIPGQCCVRLRQREVGHS